HLAHLLVVVQVQDVGKGDRLHASLRPYAAARTWMGWRASVPVPWVICKAASGQSVATVALVSACTASKSGLATLSESSKYSVLKPPVRSTAEQRSTTVTCAPGTARSTWADLVPMFCARRWQGTW